MILRIFCAAVIVFGFAYMGRLYAQKEKSRLVQLNSFCDGLNMLEFNIRYMSFPMYEALKKAGECCTEPVKSVFDYSSVILSGGTEYSSGEAFLKSVEENRNKITLSNDEVEILKSFAASLGKGDRESEIVNIQAAKTRLSASCLEAGEEVNKRAKAAKGISTLTGLFIVIVLF